LPHSSDVQSQFSSRGESPWFVDSGATNHVATSLNNLSVSTPYHGHEQVVVGDGKKLPISNVGVSLLKSHNCPVSIISLSNVLHVPHMKKSLLSVSQLTRDNNVVALFDSTSCVIKDKDSGLVLLRGILRDGLYQLVPAFDFAEYKAEPDASLQTSQIVSPSSSPPSIFVNKCTSPNLILPDSAFNVNVTQASRIGQQWHAKLGHPAPHVLRHVLNKLQISCANSTISFCDSCKPGKSHQLPLSLSYHS